MKRAARLVRTKDGDGLECSICGKKFIPTPFKPDEVLQEAFKEHIREKHSDDPSFASR